MRRANIFSTAPRVFNMKERYARIIIILFVMLLLDLVRPLSYTLHTEFLFLGVISIFLAYPYFPALVWGGIFGYIKDCLSLAAAPVNLIEFFFFFMLIRYFLYRLHNKVAKTVIVFVIIVLHILVNDLRFAKFSPVFSLLFFIQSFLIFFPLNYLLRKWMKISPAGYI
jgi:cell shape-determining protein MreD